MGEIAASFIENRLWFKDRLRSRLRQRVTFLGDYEWSPGMWEPFKHHMLRYLWWDRSTPLAMVYSAILCPTAKHFATDGFLECHECFATGRVYTTSKDW